MMVAAVSTTPNPKVSARPVACADRKTVRPPLLPSEVDNGHRRPKSREVASRYLSSNSTSSTSTTSSLATSSSYSSSSNSSSSRRFPSPLVSRTAPATPMPNLTKRSQSTERRRPVTPRPTTPVSAGGEMSSAAKLLVASKRSLSASFQGEPHSLPNSKAKPAPTVNNLSSVRKGTPERRNATPERRKAATPVRDQTENSKPSDQHRWPGRSRQMNSNFLTRSLDCGSEKVKLGGSAGLISSLQQNGSNKATIDARLKPKLDNAKLDKETLVSDSNSAAVIDPAVSDTDSVSSGSTSGVRECGSIAQVRGAPRPIVFPARFWQDNTNRLRRDPDTGSPISKNNGLKSTISPKLTSTKKWSNDSAVSSLRGVLNSRGSSPIRCAVRPSSPNKVAISSMTSPLRGMPSPPRTRNGVANTLINNLSNTPSLLSFAADARRGKMGENCVSDAHELRLLYNRHLQWRFTNARAETSHLGQKAVAEKSLYNAWVTTSKLRHSVKSKRIELQLLRQNLKLYSILKGQMLYLDNWDLIDRDHFSSLSGAVEALKASTIRLPVVGGARVDIQSLKDAICSAVDVMQAMASSICSLQAKVELVNSLLSQVANTTGNERGSINHCRDLLSSLIAIQVQDCSLRTHILQLNSMPSSLTSEL